jgi:hypothetical protein
MESSVSVLVQPVWLAALLAWNFTVLSAAQLTIRLIMAFSVRTTTVAAVVLTVIALLVSAVYYAVLGPQPSFSERLAWAPLPMVLMAIAGYAVARWILRIKRLRGQIIAGIMVGLLDPHLFTIL